MSGRKPSLTYFPTRGRAEHIRLLLELAGVDYEDRRVSWEEFPEIKPTLPFGQVPFYEDEDVSIPQSMAICRYLANKHGFFGKNDVERAQIDAAAEGVNDFTVAIRSFMFDPLILTSDEKKAALRATIARWAQVFADLLVKNNGGNGYLVGDSY